MQFVYLGDFFKEPLPSADLYILSHVIHDWDAKHVDILLNKIYTSLSPGEWPCMYRLIHKPRGTMHPPHLVPCYNEYSKYIETGLRKASDKVVLTLTISNL